MADKQQILEHLREFVMTQFPLARSRQLQDTESLLDGGIVDSMGVLELVTFIESEFRIVLTDEEVASETFESISSLASLVCQRQATDIPVSTEN